MTSGVDARYIIQAQQCDEVLKDRYELEQRIDMLERLVFVLIRGTSTSNEESRNLISQYLNNHQAWLETYDGWWVKDHGLSNTP